MTTSMASTLGAQNAEDKLFLRSSILGRPKKYHSPGAGEESEPIAAA